MVDGSEINALHMFTIVGAIIGAPITSVVEPRLLYFFFAAFLSTSFFGIKLNSWGMQIDAYLSRTLIFRLATKIILKSLPRIMI